MQLDVNIAKVIQFTDKLDKVSRSALPVAVRSTLNNAAFETKKQVPLSASSVFITRNKSFFRSSTLVNKAGGFNINSMQAEVGISTQKNKIAEGLEKQETGGNIRNRNLIAMDQARVSGSHQKVIKTANRLNAIRISKTKKKGTGTGVIMIKKGNKGTVFSVKNKRGKSSLTPLYSYSKGRQVQIKKRPFMAPASEFAQKQIPNFFIQEAEKQLKKYLK